MRRLAIRVLSRGVGSLEFIQNQLLPEDDSDEGPMVNVHGSPVRRLTAGSSAAPDQDTQDSKH